MKRIKQSLAVILSLFLLLAAMPYTALADEEIVLSVASGSDISEAFNTATRQAKDDSSGKIYKITIPAGSYTAGSQLKLWSNTYLVMDGVTITAGQGSNTMLRFGNKSDLDSVNVHDYEGFKNITIDGGVNGGTFNNNGFSTAIIQAGHCDNISIKGITFTNVKNSHHVEFGASRNVTVDSCKFTDFTGSWDSTTNYEALQFDCLPASGGHFAGYADNHDETPCANITVTNCTFNKVQRGVGTHTGIVNSYFDNVNISNNTFNNITGYAIIATNYINSKIDNNSISNCGCGIMFRSMELAHKNFYTTAKGSNKHDTYTSASSEIIGNVIEVTSGYGANYNNVAFGIQLLGEKLTSKKGTVPAGDFRISGVNVSGNTVNLNIKGYGLWLQGAVSNNVSSNTVNCNILKTGKGGTGDCIRLNSSLKNTISANVFANITASGTNDKDLICINILDGSDSNTVSGNTVSGAKKDSIKIDKSKSNNIVSNIINGAGRDGIHLSSAAKNKLTSNTITSPKRDGINLESSASVKISKNNVKKSGRFAVNFKSSNSVKLDSNKLSNSKSDGVHIEKSTSVTLNKNTISTQKRDGINLNSCKKTVITANKITSSKRYGIKAEKKEIKKDSKNKISKSGTRARSWKK